MQEHELDFLEVLKFDEIEETIGTRLRAIIQYLDKEHAVREVHVSLRSAKLRGNTFLLNAPKEISVHKCGYRSMRRAKRGDMPVNRRKCRAR